MDTFNAGQLVVCVDDSPRNGLQSTATKGQIYTVTEVFLAQVDGKPGLILKEVQAPGKYRGFWPYRFRPCHMTSIEALRQVVAEAPRPRVLEDA